MKKVLAFDIGGTNTRLALVNENYEVEKDLIYPTVSGSVDDFLALIKKIVIDLDVNLSEVCAVGAGVPGVVNKETGYIYDLPNVHIKDIDLGAFLKKEFNLPLFLRNDAEVACLAEATLGAGKKYDRVFFITISTGVGGSLCVDKEIQDYITEIGHTHYFYHGEYYEFEHIASGTGIVKLAALNGLTIKNARELFELVTKKDEKATYVYKEWLTLLSDFITMVQNSYLPDIITFTGGVMKSKDLFFESLQELCPESNMVECHFSQGAGLMGAAVLAMQHIK